MEASIKLDYGTEHNVSFNMTMLDGLGNHSTIYVVFLPDLITIMDTLSPQSYAMDTTDKMHTYRITLTLTELKVYVDGELRFSVTPVFSPGEPNPIYGFGHGTGVGAAKSLWDYVAYKTGSAEPPPFTGITWENMKGAGGVNLGLLSDTYSVQCDMVSKFGLWGPPSNILSIKVP
jgi:hypothetical protein